MPRTTSLLRCCGTGWSMTVLYGTPPTLTVLYGTPPRLTVLCGIPPRFSRSTSSGGSREGGASQPVGVQMSSPDGT